MSGKPDLAALFGATSTDTFLGLDQCKDFSRIQASSAFIGVPCATPYGSVGAYAKNGPKSLREAIAALTANIERHNFDLGGPTFPQGMERAVDCGDLEWDEKDFAKNRTIIRDAVAKIAKNGVVPIVIGGDDSVPIPMIEAMAEVGDDFTILQIDAHIDWRKEHMGERFGLSSTMRRASEMAHIKNIIQVGARGIGSAHTNDYEDAVNWGVKFFDARQIHKEGIEPVLKQISANTHLIICFDIDALDPAIAPNTIGRAPGGLSYYQALDLISGAASKAKLCAMDFVEIMPEVDVDGLGGLTVSRLVAASMGIIARQHAKIKTG